MQPEVVVMLAHHSLGLLLPKLSNRANAIHSRPRAACFSGNTTLTKIAK